MAEEKTQENMDEKRVYELAFLLSPFVSEETAAEILTTFSGMVTSKGGEIISSGEPKLRNLAYSITVSKDSKKHSYDKAYFGWLKFETTPEESVRIQGDIAGQTDVLRVMTINTVREDTFVPRSEEVIPTFEDATDESGEVVIKNRAEEDEGEVDEVELDKSLEELVVE